MTKRILAILLTLAMVLSLCSVNIFAASISVPGTVDPDDSAKNYVYQYTTEFTLDSGYSNISTWIGADEMTKLIAAFDQDDAVLEINYSGYQYDRIQLAFNYGDIYEIGGYNESPTTVAIKRSEVQLDSFSSIQVNSKVNTVIHTIKVYVPASAGGNTDDDTPDLTGYTEGKVSDIKFDASQSLLMLPFNEPIDIATEEPYTEIVFYIEGTSTKPIRAYVSGKNTSGEDLSGAQAHVITPADDNSFVFDDTIKLDTAGNFEKANNQAVYLFLKGNVNYNGINIADGDVKITKFYYKVVGDEEEEPGEDGELVPELIEEGAYEATSPAADEWWTEVALADILKDVDISEAEYVEISVNGTFAYKGNVNGSWAQVDPAGNAGDTITVNFDEIELEGDGAFKIILRGGAGDYTITYKLYKLVEAPKGDEPDSECGIHDLEGYVSVSGMTTAHDVYDNGSGYNSAYFKDVTGATYVHIMFDAPAVADGTARAVYNIVLSENVPDYEVGPWAVDNFGSAGTPGTNFTYDNHVITYLGEWKCPGWWIAAKDPSGYTSMKITFPKGAELAGQVVVSYTDGTNNTTAFAKGDAEVEAVINPDKPIQQIYVQNKNDVGTLTLGEVTVRGRTTTTYEATVPVAYKAGDTCVLLEVDPTKPIFWVNAWSANEADAATIKSVTYLKETSDEDAKKPGRTFGYAIQLNKELHGFLVGGRMIPMPHTYVNGVCSSCGEHQADVETEVDIAAERTTVMEELH